MYRGADRVHVSPLHVAGEDLRISALMATRKLPDYSKVGVRIDDYRFPEPCDGCGEPIAFMRLIPPELRVHGWVHLLPREGDCPLSFPKPRR
jgi:hypothetical protein